MTLKKKILLAEGKVLDTIKPGIDEHLEWLKKTLEVVNEIDRILKKVSYIISGDLPIINAQFMWDNQNDTYKWYDIEIKIPFHGTDDNYESKIKKELEPIDKYISDLEFNNKKLNIWFVIK